MRKFSKLLAIAILLALTLSALVACGDEPAQPDNTTTKPVVYTVAFDTQGGSSVESRTIVPGGIVQAPAEPIRIGYRFAGWYMNSACDGEEVKFPLTVNSNITLYAKWTLHPLTSEAIDNYVNSEFGDSINGYYQKTVEITTATFDFGGFAVPAGVEGSRCYYGIYGTSTLDKGSILYVSDQTQWLTMFGAGSTSGTRKNPVFELTKGNNYFYILFINYEDNSTKTYSFNIRQGSSYTVSFRNSDQNYYYVEVPFKGTVFDPNDVNNSRYAGKTYTVTDPSGEEIDIWDGILYEEDIPAEIEARAGYVLEYWYYYEDNQNKYAFKTNIEINSDMTLLAEWKAKTYNVKLSPLGCDVILNTSAQVTYGQGGVDFGVPQKYQAVFQGWYYGDRQLTTADGRLLKVWDIDIDNIELTAKWKMNQYTVTILNTNEMAGTASIFDKSGKDLGTTATLDYGSAISVDEYANNGYRFKGYTTDANTDYFVIPSETVLARDVTYYAQWDIVKYTLAFDVAGNWVNYELVDKPDGFGNIIPTAEIKIDTTPDASAKLLDAASAEIANLSNFVMSVENSTSSFSASKVGYTFAGWFYVQNGTAYRVGDEFGNIDIEKIYDLKVGQNGEDQAVTLIAGYSINHYRLSVFTTKDNTEQWINIKIITTAGEAFTGTLAAFKSAVENGIIVDTFEYNTKVELSVNVPEEHADVYSFREWKEFNDDSIPGVTGSVCTLTMNQDWSVKAKFRTEQYNIVWNGIILAEDKAEKGNAFRISRDPGEQEGHTFVGWKHVASDTLITDADGNGLGVFMFNTDGAEFGDYYIEVDTVFIPNVYNMEVSVNDVEAGQAVVETKTGRMGEIAYGESFTLTAVTNPGYTFVGWYNIVNGTRVKVGPVVDGVYEATMQSTADIAFEAVWEANRYLVKVVANDGTVSLFAAIYGKDYLLKINAAEELNTVLDIQANRVAKLANDARDLYEFIGWKYILNNVYYRLTDETGVFVESRWNVLANVDVAPMWRSIYEVSEEGSIVGITDFGKANYSELTIPSVIELTDEEKFNVQKVAITTIGSNAFENATFVTKVVLSNDVSVIGEMAFAGCVNLTEIVIGTENAGISLSKLSDLGVNAFKNCTALTSIQLPVTISNYGDSILAGCSGLEEVSYNGSMAFGKLFGTTAFENSYAVIQNGVGYYVPTNLATINVIAGISKIADYSFANLTKVENITYPTSVTAIGTAAFENSGITSVDFSNIVSIGANAFSKTKLETVELSTNLQVLGSGAFSYCSNLTSVVINHNPIEIPSSLFEGSTALASVSGVDSVKRIGKAAFKDTKLTSFATVNNVVAVGDYAFDGVVGFSTANFAKVTSIGIEAFETFGRIGKVFYKAENEGSVIGDGVEYIAPQAFKGINIASVTIPASVIEIGEGAFENCTALTAVTFAADAKIRYILPRAFYGCSSLASFTVPETIVQIGYEAFASSGLAAIDMMGATNLRVIGNKAFAYSALTSVTVPGSVTTLGTEVFRGVQSLTTAIINSLTTIPDGTFRGCSNLQEFTVAQTVVSIGNKAFAESGITKITVEGLSEERDESELSTIGELAFENAIAFVGFLRNEYTTTEKDLNGNPIQDTNEDGTPKVDDEGNPIYKLITVTGDASLPEKTENIGQGAFSGNVSLVEFSAKALKRIADNLFSGCYALNKVNLGNVIEIGNYAFYDCKELVDICYYSGENFELNKFGSGLISIGNSAFENCVNLFDQNINAKLVTLVNIGNKAFYDNKLITALEIPAKVVSIGSEAFSGCSSISDLTFAEGSALSTIGFEAFRGCRGITEITFDNAISVIERDAFNGCSALQSVVFGSGITSIGARAFANVGANANFKFVGAKAPILDVNAFDQSAQLVVKWLYKEDYKATEGWAGYNIIDDYEF